MQFSIQMANCISFASLHTALGSLPWSQMYHQVKYQWPRPDGSPAGRDSALHCCRQLGILRFPAAWLEAIDVQQSLDSPGQAVRTRLSSLLTSPARQQ